MGMPAFEWLESKLEAIERMLRHRKVNVDFSGLRKQLNANPRLLAQRSSSINTVLDFIERMVQLHGPRLKSVEIPTSARTTPGDVDILMFIDNESYAFQVKTRCIIRSTPMINMINTVNKFVEENLDRHGIFMRALFDNTSSRIRVIERRVIDRIDDYSIAAVFRPISDVIMQYELKQIMDRIKKAAQQLVEAQAGYKVVVYDARYSPIRTSLLLNTTRRLFRYTSRFHHISGVIYMRLGSKKFSHELIPLLIPVSNPRSEKPLNTRPYYYKQANNTLLEPHYVLTLPITVLVREVGWNDLLDIRPGFRVFRRGIYMGSIKPP